GRAGRGEKRPSSAFGTFSPLAGRRKEHDPRSRGEGKSTNPARGEKEKSACPACGEKEKSACPAGGEKEESTRSAGGEKEESACPAGGEPVDRPCRAGSAGLRAWRQLRTDFLPAAGAASQVLRDCGRGVSRHPAGRTTGSRLLRL